MTTRRDLLDTHNNNYNFDVYDVLSAPISQVQQLPSVSVVIPYYETGAIFERCLYFLRRAANGYAGTVEIIVVDDGSLSSPLVSHIDIFSDVHTIVFEHNRGRTEARNAGLTAATGEIVLFLDSDIMVDELLIINHVKLHMYAQSYGLKSICVSFFEFTEDTSRKVRKKKLTTQDIEVNDFRLDCVYGATWIGCDEDKRFIGQHIQLMNETDNLKSWKGQYKAWMLPNMILGGAFSVRRDEIMGVGGFDQRFAGYGFTETSAVTRMVAERANMVIPCLVGGALHIENETVNLSRAEKDALFKEKHDFYFNTFLAEQVA